MFVVVAGFTDGSASVSYYWLNIFHVHESFVAICLQLSCHFVVRLMFCILFVSCLCVLLLHHWDVLLSVCCAAARDLHCKCIELYFRSLSLPYQQCLANFVAQSAKYCH